MKEIHIVGSGFKGLKLASILSFKKDYILNIYTNCDWFIFTPYIASMIYKNYFFYTSVDKFCKNRNIKLHKLSVIKINKNIIKTQEINIKVNGKIIDCRNDTRRLLDPKKKCNYHQLGEDILKVIKEEKKRVVKGHNIHAFEISMSLHQKRKLSYIKSNKSFFSHPLIKSISKNKNMNEINNMIKLKKESKERFEVANQILPKNAQQACIEAKIISAKVLKLIPYKTTNNKNSRGTMIKIANNKSQVFIFNSKKSISNIYVSDILRSLYYFFVYQTFFVENQNKYLLFVYMIYLRLWSRCINLKEYINNLSRNLSQYFLS